MTIEQICNQFQVKGKYLGVEPIANGIINKSYRIFYEYNGETQSYLVQKINKSVFRRPDKIMNNIVSVTEHIRNKVIQQGKDPLRYVLKCGVTENGENFILDENNDYWRLYLYIENSKVYNEANDLGIIEQLGKAFGEFQTCLSDFDASGLYVSIPNFHNTARRYDDFYDAVLIDAADRVKDVTEEIEKLRKHETLAVKLSNMARNKEIPLRVTHNDTKSNNVVFDDRKKEALAVIDLDTVMPGLVAYDFGDAARFICNQAAEDETDLRKVAFDRDKFRALCKGFLGAVKDAITPIEVETLALGVYTMTVELAVRFLTDHINGDEYFRTDYPGHNLDRARCQIRLAEIIFKQLDSLTADIKQYV